MTYRLLFLSQNLLIIVVFVGSTVMPLLADSLSFRGETKETHPQNQYEQSEPTSPQKDIIPPPDPDNGVKLSEYPFAIFR
jgi:hypothetical protein